MCSNYLTHIMNSAPFYHTISQLSWVARICLRELGFPYTYNMYLCYPKYRYLLRNIKEKGKKERNFNLSTPFSNGLRLWVYYCIGCGVYCQNCADRQIMMLTPKGPWPLAIKILPFPLKHLCPFCLKTKLIFGTTNRYYYRHNFIVAILFQL